MGACNVQEERVGEEFQTARAAVIDRTRGSVVVYLLTVVSCADSWTSLGDRRRLRRGATSVQSCGI